MSPGICSLHLQLAPGSPRALETPLCSGVKRLTVHFRVLLGRNTSKFKFFFIYNNVLRRMYVYGVKHRERQFWLPELHVRCACTDSPRRDSGVGSQHDAAVELDGDDGRLQAPLK